MTKRSNVGQIYISEGFRQLWAKFMEICEREGSSGSEKIREFVREYVRRHEPGNPQTRLDVILRRGAPPYKPPSCDSCNQPAEYICYVGTRELGPYRAVYACAQHRRIHKRSSPYYGERRL